MLPAPAQGLRGCAAGSQECSEKDQAKEKGGEESKELAPSLPGFGGHDQGGAGYLEKGHELTHCPRELKYPGCHTRSPFHPLAHSLILPFPPRLLHSGQMPLT